jgi:asparagine synthase (glutamine-hydrolysing)
MGHRLGTINPKNNFSHQPFQISNGDYWIVFDGEILNANQLAKNIRDAGLDFDSEDYAEIVLNAYKIWKEKILSKLEGSFSFVIYDRTENKVFGARDPFGIRPFYYCQNENYFAFASEPKGLISLPFVSKKISKSAVYDYLILGQTETNSQSIFRGISELLPGTGFSILLPKGTIKIWSYFHLTTDSKVERYSRNKVSTLAHRLRKSLISSVNEHLTPGLKTAYHIDSSLETLAFPYLLKESIHEIKSKEKPMSSEIYSGIFRELVSDDSINNVSFEKSKKIAKDLEIEMVRSICSYDDFRENIKKVCYLQDTPFSSLEVFSQFKMLEVAKANNFKVIIEETGGNQLFSTLSSHFEQFTDDLVGLRQYSMFFDNFFNYQSNELSRWKLLQNLGKRWLFKGTANDLKETLIKTNQEEFQYIKVDFVDRYSKNLEEIINNSPISLNQLLLKEISGSLVKEKLRTSDRNSQYHKIEIRHPFVSDRELAESMIKSSAVYKIRSGVSGNLLRKAMRGVYPEFLLKNGVYKESKLELNWLLDAKDDLKEFITNDLDDFIDSRKVKRDWDRLVLMSNSQNNDFLWRIVNLGIWRNSFFG